MTPLVNRIVDINNMPRKWVVVILLGKYVSETSEYIRIKVKRFDVRKNAFTGGKYVTITSFSLSRGLKLIPDRFNLKKEVVITSETEISRAIENDTDQLFKMHKNEYFTTEGDIEFIPYQLKGEKKFIISKGDKIDKELLLEYFDKKYRRQILEDIETDLGDVRKLNNYGEILILISSAIKNRQECEVQISTPDLISSYTMLFTSGVSLYRKL